MMISFFAKDGPKSEVQNVRGASRSCGTPVSLQSFPAPLLLGRNLYQYRVL